jgi:hypothetical protein
MPRALEPARSMSWPLPAPRPQQLRGLAGERELEPSGPGGEYTCDFQLVNALTCHTQDRRLAIPRFTKPPTASSIRTRLQRTAAAPGQPCPPAVRCAVRASMGRTPSTEAGPATMPSKLSMIRPVCARPASDGPGNRPRGSHPRAGARRDRDGPELVDPGTSFSRPRCPL